MTEAINDLENEVGLTFLDYQHETLAAAACFSGPSQRACLYYRTGAGKSYTSLALVRLWGHNAAVVVAPPSTHQAWEKAGAKFGVEVEAMSHAKFRMKDTKLSRTKALIADEMHMFGGHQGQGWRKLHKLGQHLQAPLVMASATPNYNDADRVYCIESVLDPVRTKGGYLEFVYRHCNTRQNPFGMEPLIDDDQPFRNYTGDNAAAEYLADLPGVFYLPDDLVYTINDITYPEDIAWPVEVYGYDERKHRMVASIIEESHLRRYQGLVDKDGFIHDHVFEILTDLAGAATTPLLVYCDHATVAEALVKSLDSTDCAFDSVTGKVSKKEKDRIIQNFREGRLDVLVGTATLATGTDGLDKMCDWLVILDDTQDDSLRRQLIGRIMPRGEDVDASKKQVYRLVPVP